MVETTESLIIRHYTTAVRAWCERCAEPVEMVTAEQAATLTGASRRRIHRAVEADQAHFKEPPDGLLLVCLN